MTTRRHSARIGTSAALAALLAACGSTSTLTQTVTAPKVTPPPAAIAAHTPVVKPDAHETDIPVPKQIPGGHTVPLRLATGCGQERWAVKTLTDPGSVFDRTPRDTTVANLTSINPPVSPTDRVAPIETTVWRLTGVQLLAFKQEADSDIHLEISDGSQTMIVEFPDTPQCDSTATQADQDAMRSARDAFTGRYGQPTGSYQTISGTATIEGVGFFDRIHGQRGVAPDGAELHPVLKFVPTS